MNGAKGRLGEEIAAILLYRLHLISLQDLTFCKEALFITKIDGFLNFTPGEC
jgi:hypothetical protein